MFWRARPTVTVLTIAKLLPSSINSATVWPHVFQKEERTLRSSAFTPSSVRDTLLQIHSNINYMHLQRTYLVWRFSEIIVEPTATISRPLGHTRAISGHIASIPTNDWTHLYSLALVDMKVTSTYFSLSIWKRLPATNGIYSRTLSWYSFITRWRSFEPHLCVLQAVWLEQSHIIA